uniref:WIBG Mago-binding domain-containing protein n=1 Tax=Kalanchoe fedtschenkoi TaxID=63787 RepID=A0A7N0SWH8_KALFE
MAASNGRGGAGEEQLRKMEDLNRTLKEGERLLAPTRRPDGTLRKPIKIRAGYVPQEEVAIYKSKGALWKEEMESLQEVPPGYTPPVADSKPKTKSVKRNERKKEKRLQAAADKGKQPETSDGNKEELELSPAESINKGSASVESIVSKMHQLHVSAKSAVPSSQPVEVEESPDLGPQGQDIDKKIRALKKKIRLAEAQLQKSTSHEAKPEQSDKMKKLEGWRDELRHLEDTKASADSSSSPPASAATSL